VLAGDGPDVVGGRGVGGEGNGGVGGLGDDADRRHLVVHRDRGYPHAVDLEGLVVLDRDELQRHPLGVEHLDAGEVGPDNAVEQVVLHGLEDVGGRVDAHRPFEPWEDLGDRDRQAGDVVEVGVGDDHVRDARELFPRQRETQ
jgi:hypothetical protein